MSPLKGLNETFYLPLRRACCPTHIPRRFSTPPLSSPLVPYRSSSFRLDALSRRVGRPPYRQLRTRKRPDGRSLLSSGWITMLAPAQKP